MGLLVEKSNRKNLLAGACIIWSLTQIISGATNSFAVLVAMRFMLGLFVSVVEPAAFSLMGDYFPSSVRTFANSIIGTGAYLGNAGGALLVGVVSTYGWRAAYYVKGGVGVLIGILAFLLIREPRKGLMAEVERGAKQDEDDKIEEIDEEDEGDKPSIIK